MSSDSSNDWNSEKAVNGVSANKIKKKVTTKSISSYMTSKLHDKSDIGNGLEDYVSPKKNPTPKKTASVEKIYQKKTQLEHILLRPDTYIGSVEPLTQGMWVYDGQQGLEYRDITFVPGLFKIFDEILVNAADNKIRDKTMNCIKVTIQPENNLISIWNNGKGIPVIEHKTEKIYIPALIFGHLLTSSNFDDSEKKVTGGRNGYGAKLCNIFSKKFSVETACKEYGKKFKQTWTENMTKTTPPHITSYSGSDFTCITFEPDLQKFQMTELNKDIVDLFSKRAYDIAASTWGGVKVFLNDTKLPINTFKDYIDLYTKDKVDENDEPLKLAYEKAGERWEIGITNSDKGFQSISFVNSICTVKGGRHVDYIADQIITKLLDSVKKKNKVGVNIKPFQVRNHIWIFVNCLIENPTFDSQTKETMTLQTKAFGSKCVLSDKFMAAVSKTGIVESIMNWIQFKAQSQLNTKCHTKKHSKLKGIPKLDDANDAGTKNSLECTLILTEGDSAKTLAVSGLGIVGRDRYGVFPLRGKLLNVREATHKQLLENAEINNVIRILGLQYKKQYNTLEDLKTLRYGKIMIMADQDQDGSHIKGLIINFIHYNWPSLIKQPFVDQFITPIVKAFKGKEEVSFFSLPEFEEWKNQTQNWNTWRVKYYKGLGTSTSKEAKDYFSNMSLHRIKFRYDGNNDDDAILLAFSKKKIEDRKDWLKTWMELRKERKINGLPEIFLYQKNSHQLTYHEFVNKELVLFSNMDNERSIPSLCDGLKPGQRKVLFTCFKRNDKREIKVAQLAGSVGELSAYHHGEASLMGTIINLAQNFVGSNNLNLLLPIGQFGTRLHGGKDAASPRYIFTLLSPLARAIFHPMDDAILNYLYDDNIKIEPEWYIPIIPMVLVNGAEGIGTGWSTKVPNYDPREIIQNLKAMLHTTQINDGDGACPEPFHMIPKFKGFRGQLLEADEERIATYGEIAILSDVGESGDYEGNKDTVELEITELPIKRWTQDYKENVLEPMLNGTEKVTPAILDYKEYNTDSTVRFVVKVGRDKFKEAQKEGLHRFFKLQNALSTSSMVLFDAAGVINRYKTETDILKDFFVVRLKCYQKRKDYLDGLLTAESLKLNNQARFILEKIKGVIVIENKKKVDLIARLIEMKFDSDPLKKWKQKVDKDRPEESVDNEDENEKDSSGGPSYDYLLGLPLWSLTKERVDDLLEKQKLKNDELELLRKTSIEKLWLDDLDNLLKEMDKLDAKEAEEVKEGLKQGKQTASSAPKGRIAKNTSGLQKLKAETLPSKYATRIVPEVDAILKLKIEKAKESKEKKRAVHSAKAISKSETDVPLTGDIVKNESVESNIEVFGEMKSPDNNPEVLQISSGDDHDMVDANGAADNQKNGLKTKPKAERKGNVKKLKKEKKPADNNKVARSNKVLDSSESASENEFRPANDENSVDRASPLPLRARLGRTCIPKKFNFSDSEDDA